ncbi:hypothetical protein CBL_07138 [Carabus blaptoides fortunei]
MSHSVCRPPQVIPTPDGHSESAREQERENSSPATCGAGNESLPMVGNPNKSRFKFNLVTPLLRSRIIEEFHSMRLVFRICGLDEQDTKRRGVMVCGCTPVAVDTVVSCGKLLSHS